MAEQEQFMVYGVQIYSHFIATGMLWEVYNSLLYPVEDYWLYVLHNYETILTINN